jgi:hypothetical protein
LGAFFDQSGIAEVPPRFGSRLIRLNASRELVVSFEFQVGLDLGGQIVRNSAPPG